MPRRADITSTAGANDFLAEARILATLDHPGIVPVYDVGRTAEGRCYIVSKLIDGSDLAARMRAEPLTWDQTGRWWPPSPKPCITHTSMAWSTATSSRRTSSSIARAGRT